MTRPRWTVRRWYWRMRGRWARLSKRLHGYPPRPPLDEILHRLYDDPKGGDHDR